MNKIFTLLAVCLVSIYTQAQDYEKSYELSNAETGIKEYVARDYISLKPGFSYKASGDNHFSARIDECLLFPPADATYGTPDGAAGSSPSNGGVVGSIPGQFNVSPTGAATYTIPIEVPKGVNGLHPNLSFLLNSQLQNGICGVGTTLSGLSSISVRPHSPYFDESFHSVSFDGDDRFSLDGNCLIVSGSDQYGADGSIYHTESENFSRITSHGRVNKVPSWFKVETKEGVIMEYGKSSASKVELSGKNQPYIWRINRIIDQNSNYVDFEYGERNGESWIEKIKYGGNLNLGKPHIYEVLFEYDTREDNSFFVLAGIKVEQTKILKNVFIRKGTTTLRNYGFKYTKNVHSRIQSISLYGMEGEKKNSTDVKWGKKENTIENSVGINCYSAFPADFNNDGLDDLYTIEEEDGKYYERLYNSNGESLVKDSWENEIESDGALQDGAFDYNGDGLLDLFYWGPHSWTRDRGFKGGVIKRKTRRSFSNVLIDLPYSSNTPKFAFGDFKGNGYGQIFVFYSNGSCKIVSYNGRTIVINNVVNANFLTSSIFDNIEKLEIGDFNGDGKLDIGYLDSRNFHALMINENNELEEIFVAEIKGGNKNFFSVGDYNGDGITDIAYDGSLYFWTDNGVDTHHNNIPYPRDSYSDFVENSQWDKEELNFNCYEKTYHKVKSHPVNNDNKTDLIYSYYKNFSFSSNDGRPLTNEQITFIDVFSANRAEYQTRYDGKRISATFQSFIYYGVGYSIGNGNVDFIKEKGTIYIPGIYAQDKFFVLDLNGDGISQLYRRFSSPSSGGPGFSSIRYPDGLNTWFVKEIQNGIGEKIEVKYSNLSEPDDVYTLGSGANFPVKDVTPSLFVVSDVIYSNGGSSDITSKYYYSGAKIHSKGKGFLGFMSTKRKNMTTGIVSESNNILNTRYYTLVPQSSETRYGTSNKISGTTSDITLVYTGNKRFWTRTNSITKTDHLKNTSVKQAFTNYYEYGNPGTIKTEFFSGGANSGISTEKVITYTGKDGGSWCDNKPQTVTTTKTNENGSQTRTTEYDYFDNGNLKSKTQDPDKAEEVKTVFDDYDDFGNPGLKSTVTNSGTHTTIFDYSDSGVFLEREEDKASGFSSSYNFDDTNGLLMSETDHLGLTTKYEYDGFGRQTKATYPDGTYSVKSLQWAGGEGRGGAVYYSYEESSGQSPVWTWYDGQGRELRKEYYGFKDDKKIWVDTDYYSETGRLESVSKPYFAEGSKEPAESYTYDDEGRMLTKKTPMGTTTMAYDGLTTTITSPRSVKVKTVNAAGQTVSSTVDGRSVTFYYYPSGKVKESTPQGGKAVEMAYDLRGNRTKITDPDAGIVENTYNGFGEVLSEKYIMGSGEDERTVTTSYTYDESGRLEKEDRNGTITNYKYNGSNGFLESVKNPDHELTYVYDEGSDKSLGRPTSINEKIDGNTFTSRTTYDAFGREQKHTYPSGFYVRNTYTKYSHLEEVKGSNGKSIWKGEVANALGQFKKIKKGGKTTTFGYDEKDRVESIYLPDIIDHFYKFNDKGNLKSREDRLTSHKEIFTYEKHQLKTWKIEQNGNVASTFSMDYDEHGNITGKSDLGYEMQYNDERPHAISGIKGNPSLISDQEQIITYTDFKKIATVTEGDHNLTLTYGIDDQRRKGVFKTNNEITLTRYYLGDYEEEQTPDGKKRKIHYLSGGDGLSAIYVEEDGNSNFYYAYTDYLGSLTVLTDKDGNVEERQAFDPWGNRREPSDWTSLITTPVSNITGRGYTMHEHLDGFALINMNGRVYDPQIARFLSPDPQLQAPGYWLNYNRYGYCYNNPFIYTDPSGEFIFTLLASVIPGAQFLLPLAVSTDIGWMQGGMRASMQGQSFWSGAWKGGVVGAVGGGLGMIGGAGMPFVQNLLLGTGQGALVGGLDAALWGNDIGNGMLWGAAGGAVFTTLTSENFSNSLKGEGFYTNENVFNNMMKRGMGEQAILNYFGFDGTYTGTTKGPGYVNGGGKGTSFFGSTDPQTGNIKYGDLAFDSYEKLKMTYNKEMYHSLRVKNGIPLESQGTAFGKHLKYYPEERLGFIHAYKNQGLYPSAGKGLMGNISFYQSQSFNLNPSQYYSAKWWHFVYKIPRRW